jgi:lysophospholipase L1-like esterase
MIGTSVAEGIPQGYEAKCFNTVNGKATSDSDPIRIACIGDSITFGTAAWGETKNGYNYPENNFYYPTVLQSLYGYDTVVGNFGFPGSNISSTSYSRYYTSCSYNMMMSFEPDIIVMALGTNNAVFIASQMSTFKNDYKTMIEDIHKRYPEAKLIMTTAIYRWDDWSLQIYAEGNVIPCQIDVANQFDYVTLYDTYKEFKPYGNDQYYRDKLHPNNAGYEKLAEVMKKGVDALIGK